MKGADVNFEARQNITPLHVAAKWGKANSVNLLLDNNAKIDAKTRVRLLSICFEGFKFKILYVSIKQGRFDAASLRCSLGP